MFSKTVTSKCCFLWTMEHSLIRSCVAQETLHLDFYLLRNQTFRLYYDAASSLFMLSLRI